jgi:filamentous hemagglutinin family protein
VKRRTIKIFHRYWKLSFAGLVSIGYTLSANCAVGQQLQVDNTLGGESSVVQPGVEINGTPSDLIQGGAVRGSNLFHSFLLFGVGEDRGVYFANPSGVERIITRVTGSNPSEILGVLGINGGDADLFLINPNGILFGPNASLDLNGSFLASTASSIAFADTQFSAVEPSSFPLLSVNVPVGLSFRNLPTSITNQSQVFPADAEEPTGLQVKPGKSLALVGGDIVLESGTLTASNGRIELASLERAGEVQLDANNFAISFAGEQNFGDIRLLEGSVISTEGEGSGDIHLQGRNIEFTGGSSINALSLGSEPGGTVKIDASEAVLLEGINLSTGFPSYLLASTLKSGKGGNIEINASELILRDGAIIQTSAISAFFDSGEIIAATGQAGNITIVTQKLDLEGDSLISAKTSGMSNGGDILINAADSINISGFSQLSTESMPSSSLIDGGAAGNITFKTKFLKVSDGSAVTVSSEGTGKAGNLTINAQSISLENQSSFSSNTRGSSGNINLNSENIILRTNSSITTNATGVANGGNISIDTGALVALENSDITANSQERFGGRVVITAEGIFGTQFREELTSESDITATSDLGPDFSGTVDLNTPDVDPSQGLTELPASVVDPDSLVAQNPCKRGSESEFTRSGRGGLPPSLSQDFNSNATQVGLVEPVRPSTADRQQTQLLDSQTNSLTSVTVPIAPAQGWVFNDKGKVVLVSYNPSTAGPQRLKAHPAGCPVL